MARPDPNRECACPRPLPAPGDTAGGRRVADDASFPAGHQIGVHVELPEVPIEGFLQKGDERLGLQGAADWEVFAEVRERKNRG